MSEKPENPQAFPVQASYDPCTPDRVMDHGTEFGMTLLDYFAGLALSGLLADTEYKDGTEGAAHVSYNYAEAMLCERERRTSNE